MDDDALARALAAWRAPTGRARLRLFGVRARVRVRVRDRFRVELG